MEIKIQKKKEHPLSERMTIPVSATMKTKIDQLKEFQKIDFNEMVRDFLTKAISQIEKSAA